MYIAARVGQVNEARGRAAFAFAVEAGARSSEMLGFPVFTWQTLFSADGPAVGWSARLDHLADVVAIDDTLYGNDEFAQWVEDNIELFVGQFSDSTVQVMYGAPTGPPKTFVNSTRAVAANGYMTEAMGLGVELAETATRITSVPVMFVTLIGGVYGSVGWISSVDDLAEMEAANAALGASDEWLKLVDRVGHAFNPGTTTTILRRLG